MFFSVCSSSFSVLLLSNDTGDLAVVVILGRLKGPRWDLKAVKGFRNGFLILVTPATSLGSCLAQDGSLEFRQFFVSGLSLDLCVGLFVLVCFEAGGNLSHAPPRHLLSWSLRSETKEQTIYLYKPSWVLCLIPVDNSPDLFSFFSSVAGLSPHFSPCPHSSGAAFPGPDTRHIGHTGHTMAPAKCCGHWPKYPGHLVTPGPLTCLGGPGLTLSGFTLGLDVDWVIATTAPIPAILLGASCLLAGQLGPCCCGIWRRNQSKVKTN